MARTTIRTEDVTAGAISGTDLAANSVGNTQMADDAVGVDELSATGTASATTALFGDNAWKAVSDVSGFSRYHIPTAGTYTVPAGVTKIIVECQGAGGSGAGAGSPAYGSGGSGGGYAKKALTVVAGDTMTVAVGTGGAEASGGQHGTAGTVSSFTSLSGTSFTAVVGNGGGAGQYNANNNPAGTGTGGDINIQGMRGGYQTGGQNQGGDSFLGIGAHPFGTQAAANPSTGYGAGGHGGYAVTNAVGAAGRVGVVIVTEYK